MPPLFSHRPWLRLMLGWGMCLALVAVDLAWRTPVPEAAQGQWPMSEREWPGGTLKVQAEGQIPMPPATPTAHASTLLALPPQHPAALLAFWFAGSRESGPDVQIVASQFDRRSQQWSPARVVVHRERGLGRLGFGLRRLGNPVAWRDVQGRIHLFVVATGMGGWAASRILHLRQVDDGSSFEQLEFEPLGVLPLSWLWNISHLVRTMPLPLRDGGMVLPVYFELGVKYPLALRFDAAGEFRGMVRISQRTHLLQPTLLLQSPQDWLALMRDSGADRKIKVATSHDGGQQWQDLPDLPLHNPDSAIAGLSLAPGVMVLAHNSDSATRAVLDLSLSSDGLHWSRIHRLAQGAGGDEYSYPSLAWGDGSLWVSYTDQRRAIAWQRLTPSP